MLPCRTNTQQEGSALLTNSQLMRGAAAAGGERDGVRLKRGGRRLGPGSCWGPRGLEGKALPGAGSLTLPAVSSRASGRADVKAE